MAKEVFRVGEDRLTRALKSIGLLKDDESIGELELKEGELYVTVAGEWKSDRYLKRTGNWPLKT